MVLPELAPHLFSFPSGINAEDRESLELHEGRRKLAPAVRNPKLAIRSDPLCRGRGRGEASRLPWFRVHGPEKAILDKSWRLPDIERVN